MTKQSWWSSNSHSVTVKIKIQKQDVKILNRIVSALSDPVQRAVVERTLPDIFANDLRNDLKILLRAAPLKGLGHDRSRELDRDIAL